MAHAFLMQLKLPVGLQQMLILQKSTWLLYCGDGQKICVPSIYDEKNTVYVDNGAGEDIIVSDNTSQSTLVNINSATQNELQSLPGIGASTASKIINYRNKNGKFKKIEDLMNVDGIGEAKFNNLKDYISI